MEGGEMINIDQLRLHGLQTEEFLTKLKKLNGRQKEVLILVGEVEGSKAIAKKMGISVKALASYKQRIHLSLGISPKEFWRLIRARGS
jgi:DNA-binding NarL/FixJ family response regulator